MIKVGLSCSVLTRGRNGDGIASYTANLVRALDPLVEIAPYVFEGEELERQALVGPRFPVHVARSQLGLDSFSGQLVSDLSLVHCTDHRIPRLDRKPLVATIFDAVPFHHPEWARSDLRRLKNWLMRRSGRWPDRVICASEYAAEEVCHYWGVAEDIIRIVPLAVDEERFKVDPVQALAVRQTLGLPDRYYLFVGTLQPRKNLQRLLQAHRLLSAAQRKACPLVIVGGDGWLDAESRRELEEDPGVIRLGFLSQADLNAVYVGALALVVPSLHEGFGLPVLEGYAAGVPVLCSNSTSLPEVAQDGALYFDPLSIEEMRDALGSVLEDSVRASLIGAGRQVLDRFSWERTALETLSVYREVL